MAMMDDKAAKVSKGLDASRPDWRRQSHTRFLAGLAVANVALDGLAGIVANYGSSFWAMLIIGAFLGQLFLMGLWMALGGLHFMVRFAAVAALTMAGTAACNASLEHGVGLRNLMAFSGMIVLATHAVLFPLRALLGWRIDFDPAYHERSADKSMQLRLTHLIGFTTACALPFSLVRAADDADALLQVLAFGSIGLVASAPVAWVMIAARRTWRFWLAACGMLVASLVVDLWTLGRMSTSASNRALLVYLGVVTIVSANLGVLRLLCGLQLFSVLEPVPDEGAANDSSPLDADLAYLVEAWPRLPEELRSELLQQVRSAVDSPAQQEFRKCLGFD